jgi:uncharacterized protein (TIGR00290 family)
MDVRPTPTHHEHVQPGRVLLSWSGGKDSCLALYKLLQERPSNRVEALLTTVTADFDRISMHGVRRDLLESQARRLGLPIHEIAITKAASNAEYESALRGALAGYRDQGITTVAFGDLFLADIRAYRDRLLADCGMVGLYPIWGRDTSELIREFIAFRFRAVLVCVDPVQLDPSFLGREIDERFLSDLPEQVDPCGENGEFHTFVFDGPLFSSPVPFSIGERVIRDGFWFCDLLLAGS